MLRLDSRQLAEGAQLASASRALGARVAAAVDRSTALHTSYHVLRAQILLERARAAALRRQAAERRSARWAPLRADPVFATPAAAVRASGRVVRRLPRCRHAAASSSADSDGHGGKRPGGRWAHAAVLATRTVVDLHDDLAVTASSGEPAGARTWTVREIDARGQIGARGERCLVFENHEVVRRVWEFPPTWTTLPAAELLRIAGIHDGDR